MENLAATAPAEWRQWMWSSPIGLLYLVASARGLRGIHFGPQSATRLRELGEVGDPAAILRQTVAELGEYFLGKRRRFTVPLEPVGTDFQRAVWEELRKIPYGETVSYREIAKRVKRERAVRAVGTANGRNPLCIIVPCHRVIAADGTLGGYAGGLEVKLRLLSLEGSLKLAPFRASGQVPKSRI